MNAVTDSGLSLEQMERLQQKLVAEREKITARLGERRTALGRAASREPDDGDWASSSADQSLLARLTDRDSKLLGEVERALGKGEGYGLDELTGEPIGFERLWVRPWARHAVASKERVERQRVRSAGNEVLGREEEEVA
jgi:RNA polymerase-binding transcription factor